MRRGRPGMLPCGRPGMLLGPLWVLQRSGRPKDVSSYHKAIAGCVTPRTATARAQSSAHLICGASSPDWCLPRLRCVHGHDEHRSSGVRVRMLRGGLRAPSCVSLSLRVCRRWPPIGREELRQSVDVLLRNSKLATYPKVSARGRGRSGARGTGRGRHRVG